MTPLNDIVAAGNSVFAAPVPEGCSHIFAPCLDPDCERPCGARRSVPEITLAIEAERRAAATRLRLVPLVAVLALLTLACVPQGIANIRNVQIAEREP